MANPSGLKLDRAGMRKLMSSSDVGDACLAVAKRGAAYAASIAPKNDGSYAKGFVAKPATITVGGAPRAAAQISNDDPAAVPQEFGNRRVRKPLRILGRTVDHLQ